MTTTLEDCFAEINRLDKKITHAGQQLLGFQNERRTSVLDARKLEINGKLEDEQFRLRYHHAVEDVREAEKQVEAAAKAHKESKESEELALEALTQLEDATEEEQAAEEEKKLPIIQHAERGSSENEGWRILPLDSLRLSKAILEKLAKPVHKHSDQPLGDVTTLGGLADLLNKHQLSYGQIKGMSSATAGKIEEAWMEFWQENPMYCSTKAESLADTPVEKLLIDDPSLTEPINVEVLSTHGATKKTVTALQSGGYAEIDQLATIITDDDLLGDVVGQKALKNVRLAYESWKAMAS